VSFFVLRTVFLGLTKERDDSSSGVENATGVVDEFKLPGMYPIIEFDK
jgi:hypothetical protein